MIPTVVEGWMSIQQRPSGTKQLAPGAPSARTASRARSSSLRRACAQPRSLGLPHRTLGALHIPSLCGACSCSATHRVLRTSMCISSTKGH